MLAWDIVAMDSEPAVSFSIYPNSDTAGLEFVLCTKHIKAFISVNALLQLSESWRSHRCSEENAEEIVGGGVVKCVVACM